MKDIQDVARRLGARPVAELPDVGGGAFGAARLARIVAELQGRLMPGNGRRPGRPTDAGWDRRPKVPMSRETERRLARLADRASAAGHRVTPMQVAARILEEALGSLDDD